MTDAKDGMLKPSEHELISRVASAIVRDGKARQAWEDAAMEERAAAKELADAWTALRAHQDEQVKAALLRETSHAD